MKIYIVRHGETDWNKCGIIQGRTDIPLNDTGRQQAQQLCLELSKIPFDCIYCSPLLRTRQTADIINADRKLPVQLDERLYERNFGDYEGTCVKNLDFRQFWNLQDHTSAHREESAKDFFSRVQNFLDDIIKMEYKHVLLVAHGGVSLPVYDYFYQIEEATDYLKYMLKNCEVACYDTSTMHVRT